MEEITTMKTAIVTGCSREVGRTIALELAARGYALALVVKSNKAAAQRLCDDIRARGGEAEAWAVDLTCRDAVVSAVRAMQARFSTLDVLVNNAGATAHAPLLTLSDEQWRNVLEVNLTGSFILAAEVARLMQSNGGVVINIAGASAHRCYPGAGAFGPSKAAIVNLTAQMAIEWAPLGIRVCGVSPGPIRSDNNVWQTSEPELAAEVQRLPLKRAVTPEEVARTVCFLASDDAASVTGQMLIVDGGGACTWYMTA